jgi:dihydrofolate reductase
MTWSRVIAKDGRIPWHIPEESRLYESIIARGTLIMGRKVFEEYGRPLPRRHNIIVSTTLAQVPGADVCRTFGKAVEKAREYKEDVFVIGGTRIYREALDIADCMRISYIREAYEGDTFFPQFDESEWDVAGRKEYPRFEHVVYVRRKKQVSA